jgi:hypothetical protein
VGAREGEFMVEEEALEDDLSLREKSPIVAVVSVVPPACIVEWDGMLVGVVRFYRGASWPSAGNISESEPLDRTRLPRVSRIIG